MADTARGQVTRSAADVYEEFFVPALFVVRFSYLPSHRLQPERIGHSFAARIRPA